MSQHVGPIRDLRDYLINDRSFQPRRTLPKNKRFCTSSTLSPESEGKLWGHVVTLEGGRQVACAVGYQPEISRTHGFISVFALDEAASACPVRATVSMVSSADSSHLMRSAEFRWSDLPKVNADLEQVAGLFPIKLFTSRLAEGKPHERIVEVTVQLDNTETEGQS